MSNWQLSAKAIDDRLSKRHIPLDPAGYFIVLIDREEGWICARHFGIVVNARGLAVDPTTGKPISAKAPAPYPLEKEYRARTAKELCVEIFEKTSPPIVTLLDHAAYLGREFQRAEYALFSGEVYVQD